MTYTKPQLSGYQAINAIQGTGKGQSAFELGSTSVRTPPAYEADE